MIGGQDQWTVVDVLVYSSCLASDELTHTGSDYEEWVEKYRYHKMRRTR